MSRRDEGRVGLGRAIRLVRTGQDLNRKELAERTGLSYPYLSEIESGKKTPSSKALSAIADALDVPASTLMEMAEAEQTESGRRISGSTFFHVGTAAVTEPSPPPPSPAASMPPPLQTDEVRSLMDSAKSHFRKQAAGPDEDEVAEIAEVARTLGPEDRNRLLDFARRLRR